MNSTKYGKRTQAFVTQFFLHLGIWLFPYKEKYHKKTLTFRPMYVPPVYESPLIAVVGGRQNL
jgi:hypothetical protein